MKIVTDLKRYENNSSLLIRLKIILFSSSFHIVILYRLSSFFYRKVPIVGNFIGILFEYFNRILFACDISRKSNIEEGLVIVHGMGVVIGDDVKIGKNVKILNCVNIGNKNTEISYNQQPIIGNNVVIGAGSKILGKVKIGNNVIIGANSVVLNDIENNSVVAGIPAEILKKR